MSDTITAPVTISATTITAPITIGGTVSGGSGSVDETPVTFANTDLTPNGNFYEITFTHSKNVNYIPLHTLTDGNGELASVPVTWVNANQIKLTFPAPITGTWTLTYI